MHQIVCRQIHRPHKFNSFGRSQSLLFQRKTQKNNNQNQQRNRKEHQFVVQSLYQEAVNVVEQILDVISVNSPNQIRPVLTLLENDVLSLLMLRPEVNSILRITGIWYLFFGRPSPLGGFLDFYLLGPISKLIMRRWNSSDFVLRNTLGGGNYGITYEGVQVKDSEISNISKIGELDPELKKQRVVLKRVNIDKQGVRKNFFKAGTIARGPEETGAVEIYMNSKVSRNLFAKRHVAEFRGQFTADESIGGFTKGTNWLVFKYESDSTLADACEGKVQQLPFPENLYEFFLQRNVPEDKAESEVIKAIMKDLFKALYEGQFCLKF
eukprot:TRINITY_DN28572_c0_g2_i2.p1 TRINITY_DN28572_c0_g2~~TRINITY_DN28572_c0_g2_i2.p1  ORF type:complete len:324 (-),score=39.59 TRINITY_DN28572_c0_g2_i2:59-1030(-)